MLGKTLGRLGLGRSALCRKFQAVAAMLAGALDPEDLPALAEEQSSYVQLERMRMTAITCIDN